MCSVEVRNGEVWVRTTFGHANPVAHWHQRLADGLAHDLGLAKAVHGQLAADVPRADIVRQVVRFGAQNPDGWGVGLTILTALANLLPDNPALVVGNDEFGLATLSVPQGTDRASPALYSSFHAEARSLSANTR